MEGKQKTNNIYIAPKSTNESMLFTASESVLAQFKSNQIKSNLFAISEVHNITIH